MQLNRIFLFISILLVTIFHRFNGQKNDIQTWKNAGITPNPIQTVPAMKAQVRFPSDEVVIQAGVTLSVSDAATQPELIKHPYNESDEYTYMYFDAGSLYLRWLTVNIPGKDSDAYWNTYNGDYIVWCKSPEPPPGSGTHYYVVLVYQQSHSLNVEITEELKERTNFQYLDFANEYNLTLNSGTFFAIHTSS